MGGGEATLEQTPTWAVACVCLVLVVSSLAVHKFFYHLGKLLRKNNRQPLYEALVKIEQELMLVGFMSLILTVFQDAFAKICISKDLATKFLPCELEDKDKGLSVSVSYSPAAKYCTSKGKVPLLSTRAFGDLDTFLFVVAVTHVVSSALLFWLGQAKIRPWKVWEVSVPEETSNMFQRRVSLFYKYERDFIMNRFRGTGWTNALLVWLISFFKLFYGSVTKVDYATLRRGFIMTHCRGNERFNFHEYMMRAFESDFKKVVGISEYLWLFGAILLLSNVHGWHAYFSISFIPLTLLIALGTKLEHIIMQLAYDSVVTRTPIEGHLVVRPSDKHFWFGKPQIVLKLLHFILFQNSFELSYIFCIWFQYGSRSCLLDQIGFLVPRLVIGLFIQVLCSYSVLPLYAIVSLMGSSLKPDIFHKNVQAGLLGWAEHAKTRTNVNRNVASNGQDQDSQAVSAMEENNISRD